MHTRAPVLRKDADLIHCLAPTLRVIAIVRKVARARHRYVLAALCHSQTSLVNVNDRGLIQSCFDLRLTAHRFVSELSDKASKLGSRELIVEPVVEQLTGTLVRQELIL